MKVLHSADWHLGKRLYRQKREAEHAAFLDWLLATIDAQNVDVLIVAGDIFDTAAPPIAAQELYYDFLFRLSKAGCLHAVITAGNHDSPTFLDAPQALLKQLNIHIIGAVNPQAETFILPDRAGNPALIVSAVPYLRERDLRQFTAGETLTEKATKTKQAIAAHYADESTRVRALREKFGDLPALAMGHLFAAGATTTDDDGVRELYVGSLARIGADIFPPDYDYVALGHIHVPQIVAGCGHIRYSGSPIAMGFGEAGQQKQVLLLEVPARAGEPWAIESLPVPCFQALGRYKGDRTALAAAVSKHVAAKHNIWLELFYTGAERDPNLHQDLQALCQSSEVRILCIRNEQPLAASLQHTAAGEDWQALTPESVFQHCLTANEIPAEQQAELIAAYGEILAGVRAG